MYITVLKGEIVECETLLELALCFNITVSSKGEVSFNGRVDTISYNMNEWEKHEVLADFAKNRLSRFANIYKAEKL